MTHTPLSPRRALSKERHRETVERTDVEMVVEVIKSVEFAALVKEIPGYDTSHTGEVTNVSDVIG